jgi:diguanylate cyclase (GGDEF)-like protein
MALSSTFVRSSGSVVLTLAGTVLSAWLVGLDAHPGTYAVLLGMKANAAVAFALLAGALLLLDGRHARQRRRLGVAAAAVAGLIGAVTLAQYFFDWDAGIDRLLARDVRAGHLPGRASPLTAASLVTMCIALACAATADTRKIVASQCLSLVIAVFAVVTLLGYLYRAPGLLAISPYVPMAWNTAVAVLALALGIFTLHPLTGLAAPLCGSTAAARLGRRLLLSVALALPLLAWLTLWGQSHRMFSMEFGTGLLVTVSLIMLALLIGFHTAVANLAEIHIRYLNRVYSMLSDVNSLIVRVNDRAELFAEASRIAKERGGFPRAWFGLVDRDRARIELVAGADAGGLDAAAMRERLSLRPGGAGFSPIARAVLGAQPVVSNDVALDTDDPFREELLMHGIRSYAVFPLSLDDQVIGVFKLHAGEPNCFHGDELALLNELVGDIVFAIHNLEQRRRLDHLAYFDSLSNLANAKLLEERLNQAIDQAIRCREGLALLVFDIVAFKAINDAFGRQTGDETLKVLAGRLVAAAGAPNCGRLGSNQFAVLVPGQTLEAGIAGEYERIASHCFGTDYDVLGHRFTLSARCGIAMVEKDGADAETLIGNAEAAVRAARAAGQRYRFYNERSNARIAERFKLHGMLSHAFERAEFALHYQSKIDCRTMAPCGAEALLRWHSRDMGAVSPAQFIPLLEEIGLIDKIGTWALSQAAADSSRHIRALAPGFRVAVNVSAAQLLQPDFVERVHAALGPGLADVDIELTESQLMTDIDSSVDKLRRLRELGLKIALDDFGTGYSSMAYLAKLPLDYLKIDRAFVVGLPDDAESLTVISSIISLGHALGLQVIAEGVERADQAAVLAALGCDQLQGFHFSRAEPLPALLERLTAGG